MHFFRLIKHLIFFIILTTCAKEVYHVEYGVQPDHASFVPARIAVLDCRLWPNGARFQSLPLTDFKKADITSLCEAFDRFVLKGFDGQPFMRGISPKAVNQALLKEKGSLFIKQLDKHWSHNPTDCQECRNPPSFYAASIANRTEWRMWLTELSRSTKNADAALVPFVTYGFARSFNDRGIIATERVAGIALFLIDTNSGYLLWAGGREAKASNQSLVQKGATQDPPLPPWEQLYDRLFIDEVWKEFPGRQVYH